MNGAHNLLYTTIIQVERVVDNALRTIGAHSHVRSRSYALVIELMMGIYFVLKLTGIY